MNRNRLPLGAAAGALSLALAGSAAAQVPDLLPYQGYLTDDAGEPYDGSVSLTFRLYNSGDAPGSLWNEAWDDVPVEDGVFYVYLGMFSPIADAIGSGNARYLGVSVGGEGEATPRQQVGSVPFALVARDAESLGGYTADDFVTRLDLGAYARWDTLGERGYVTWDALGERGYATAADLEGYATEQWVRDWVGEQGYVTAEALEGIDLEGYATEQWVMDYVGDQGYVTGAALDAAVEGHATEQYVRDYVGARGYVTGEALDARGYIGADALADYATQQWVRDRGYATEQYVRDYVGARGYVTGEALDARGYVTGEALDARGYVTGEALGARGYATEQYVRDHVAGRGYLTAADLDGYATEQYVQDYVGARGHATEQYVQDYVGARGYATEQYVQDYVAGRGYVTGADVDARGYVTGAALDARGYVTGAALDARGYVTTAALDARGYVTTAALDARGYATTAQVDTLRADVSRTYVTNNALDARGYVTIAALDARNYATNAALTALQGQVNALSARVDALAQAGSAYLLGRSAQATNGRIRVNNQSGLRGANEMCRSSYPNEPTAHFCSPDEVFRAVTRGNFDAAAVNAMDGVWTWTVPDDAVSGRGNNSLAGTCQNLMYNSADVSSGTRIRVDFNYTSNGNGGGLTGDVVQIQKEVNCGGSMPVLCCR